MHRGGESLDTIRQDDRVAKDSALHALAVFIKTFGGEVPLIGAVAVLLTALCRGAARRSVS